MKPTRTTMLSKDQVLSGGLSESLDGYHMRRSIHLNMELKQTNNCTRLLFVLCLVILPVCQAAAQDVAPGATPPWTKGKTDAPLTLEVFNDYQCPPCQRFYAELKQIEPTYRGRVRIVARNYPLTNIHRHAAQAARAAEAAGLQGQFWRMVETLYQRQSHWGAAKSVDRAFVSYARKLGLDVKRFDRDMNGDKVAERIAADVKRGVALKVTGTPEVFINGRKVEAGELTDLRKALNDRLLDHR